MEVRDLILETAFKGFVEKGFDNISLNELIKRTGLTKGAFYYYFKNKDDLLREIYEKYLYRHIDKYLDTVKVEEGSSLNKLETMIKSVVEMHTYIASENNKEIDSRSFYRLFNAGLNRDPRLKQMNRERTEKIIDNLIKIIEQGKTEGIIRQKLDTRGIARLISSTVKGSQVEWLSTNVELENILRGNIDTILEIIRPLD